MKRSGVPCRSDRSSFSWGIVLIVERNDASFDKLPLSLETRTTMRLRGSIVPQIGTRKPPEGRLEKWTFAMLTRIPGSPSYA